MEEKDLQNELASIRSIMERSSKFISLSGLSGILAGIYALIGAAIAYLLVYSGASRAHTTADVPAHRETLYYLVGTAILILFLSLVTCFVLSKRQAKRKGQAIWGKISQSLMFHMAVPLITGGILVLIFISRGYYGIISPCCLIFYGLSLISASNFTFGDVKYLGLLEIVLGLVAACFPGYGLLFWAIGFGVLHIIYGSMMYLKYDK
jgi:hypothetical protein